VANVTIHYDVGEHEIKLETFITSAQATALALSAIANGIFGSDFDYSVVVVAPSRGSFRQVLKVKLGSVSVTQIVVLIAGLATFDETQMGEGVAERLTGKPIREWVFQGIDGGMNLATLAREEVKEKLESVVESLEQFASCAVEAVFQASRDEIRQLNLHEKYIHDLESAQCSMFAGLLRDADVQGVGFGDGDEFPLPRREFPARAVGPKEGKRDDDIPDWRVTILDCVITSPNFKKRRQKNRKWIAEIQNAKDLYFEIHDEGFWQRIAKKEFGFTESTQLTVQLATRYLENKPKEYRVIRVLSVDGTRIAHPLTGDAISAIIGQFRSGPDGYLQDDLFG
jgi:hypothetical protein